MTEINYTYEPDANRIVATTEDGQKAGEIVYAIKEDYWDANHTWVDPELRGYNIARNLVNMLADTARAANVKIKPTCSYAKHVMEKEQAFDDVLYKGESL